MAAFKVIVAGSRGFANYDLMKQKLDILLSRQSEVYIVSGCARGADSLAIRYAEERGLRIIRCPADWNRYGKSAGYRRNEEMAKLADAVVAFWDGKSRGTAHMIGLAKEKGLMLRVIRF